jgi:hypothetical protein
VVVSFDRLGKFVALCLTTSDDKLRAMPHYRVNRPDVMMESFEGEVIIIHMKRGDYYSLRGSAPLIWDMIGQGFSSEKTGDSLAGKYPAEEQQVRDSVRNLVEQFISEDLIVPRGTSSATSNGAFANVQADVPFELPLLERYTDMQDLLLLDPIHEVDETGWPARKADDKG